MQVPFDHAHLCTYLLQALVLKYIYQRFFNEPAKALAMELAKTIEEKQQLIVDSGLYLLTFAAASRWLLFLKEIRGSAEQRPNARKGKEEEVDRLMSRKEIKEE